MAQVLIQDLEPDTFQRLTLRATRNHRSLEEEVKSVLALAANDDLRSFRAAAARLRLQLEGRAHTDSSLLLAEDRSR